MDISLSITVVKDGRTKSFKSPIPVEMPYDRDSLMEIEDQLDFFLSEIFPGDVYLQLENKIAILQSLLANKYNYWRETMDRTLQRYSTFA